MENFAKKRNADVQTYLYEIRAGQAANHQKSWDAGCFLEQQVALLKEFTLDYVFRDEAEEILFFKQTKPKLVKKTISNNQSIRYKLMKTDIITIESSRVYISGSGEVWMPQHQIADLFGCFVAKVNANVRSILGAGVLDETNACRTIATTTAIV